MTTKAPPKINLILRNDHNRFRTAFNTLLNNQSLNNRLQLKNQLVKELSQHDNVEQQVVHPVFRYLRGNESPVDKSILNQETRLIEKIYEFDKLDINDSKFHSSLNDLFKVFTEHSEYEESNEFPAIETELPPDYLENLNSTIEAARKIAPTRPHPSAPLKPSTGGAIVSPIAAFIDKLRDLRREFPQEGLGSGTQTTNPKD